MKNSIYLEAVKYDGYSIKYTENQTEALYLEAVRQDGKAIMYITDQTEALCLEAVIRVSLRMFTLGLLS